MTAIATITPTPATALKDTPAVSPQQPRLLDRVRDRLRVKHYSYRTVQELLGHADVSTTMIYTHVLNRGGRGVVSPLDRVAA